MSVIDVRRVIITEGIKLELQNDHARELNNLKDLYVYESGKVIKLEEKVRELRREVIKQKIEFEDEFIETIEEMEDEKRIWKSKYEEVLKLTEILIVEFERQNREDETQHHESRQNREDETQHHESGKNPEDETQHHESR